MLPIKTIIEKIRVSVKDTDEEQNSYKDSELLDYVNSGIRFIRRSVAQINPFLLVDYDKTFTLLDDNCINLESNVSKVVRVVCNGVPLVPTNYFEIKNEKEYGTPRKFCMIGTQKIKVFPVPNTTTELNVMAINDSGELNIGDTSPFNTDLDDMVIEYALIRCGMSDRFDMSQETTLFSSILSQINNIAGVYSESVGDGY